MLEIVDRAALLLKPRFYLYFINYKYSTAVQYLNLVKYTRYTGPGISTLLLVPGTGTVYPVVYIGYYYYCTALPILLLYYYYCIIILPVLVLVPGTVLNICTWYRTVLVTTGY